MVVRSVFVLSLALALPNVAYGQRRGLPPAEERPTKAEAQKLVELISGDKAKTQHYCDIGKLNEQMAQAEQIRDKKTLASLARRADDLARKIGPDYLRLIEGLERLGENSGEGQEIITALDALERLCIR